MSCLYNFWRTCSRCSDFFCTAVTCYVNDNFSSNISYTLRYLNEWTCSTGSPLMTIEVMTVLLRRKSMHISVALETFRCRFFTALEERTTEERYDWYEAKSLKRASMAVSSENLTNLVDGSTLRQSFVYKVYKNSTLCIQWLYVSHSNTLRAIT